MSVAAADAAMEKIEKWNLRLYYFNMLQYASAKRLPWPRIDFTCNGQLLFRLQVDADEGEFTLKYFGAQEMFLTADRTKFRVIDEKADEEAADDDSEEPFPACPLLDTGAEFEFILPDRDAPSKICYAATFAPLSLPVLDKMFAVVQRVFQTLESNASTALGAERFATAPQWSVEQVFYSTTHDATAVAIEYKAKEDENIGRGDDLMQAQAATDSSELEREWRQLQVVEQDQSSLPALHSIISSCQLHADVWQYNDKHRITAVGRQYENISRLARLGDAMHVPFRGAADDLQKKIYIGEYLVKMLPTLCTSLNVAL